ncbi:MAG: hypothetical protein HY842_14100 [Bacteroidetes bacterium]|nr:hypothetical protein [Bacteroidota bacterium]
MNLKTLLSNVTDKSRFQTLQGYVDFCRDYLEYIAVPGNLQATIVSQNENHYCFYQYAKSAGYQITRPINNRLMFSAEEFEKNRKEFLKMLRDANNTKAPSAYQRDNLNNSVYTIQQSIGAALDALPAGKSNTARKLNGDLFERFIRLIVKELGLKCEAGIVQVPVEVDGEVAFKMSYQHDLIISKDEQIKILGSVKTSSKDRLDKIFVDKFLYNRLTETAIPHIAIFLNDVQRKNTKKENEYGINSTFLPGHFKGYTVKLNPLDGVYYCDIRPNMLAENILKDHIKTFDKLVFEDIWRFMD